MGVDPDLLERWLAARDHVSMRSTWEALPSTKHRLEKPPRKLTQHGVALLAEHMLGERADWLVHYSTHGQPVYNDNRISDGSFLDHVWDIRGPNKEGLQIHERRDGLRGVQRISISSGTIEGRPEGGGVIAVRVFDRDRAAVIPIDHYGVSDVATIGDIELAPLDLFACSWAFKLPTSVDVPTVRALIAQLASEVDAHYDVSPQWASGAIADSVLHEWYLPDIKLTEVFVDGSRSVVIGHDKHGRLWAEAFGLAWGQRLWITFEHDRGYLVTRFANTELDRLQARLGVLARIM